MNGFGVLAIDQRFDSAIDRQCRRPSPCSPSGQLHFQSLFLSGTSVRKAVDSLDACAWTDSGTCSDP